MATKRKRGNAWQYIFKRAGVLETPLALTFRSEEEGDEYARKLEALLDRGIVPTEHQVKPRILTIENLIRQYGREAHPSGKDVENLRLVEKQVGNVPWATIDANWVDCWIAEMKRVDRYAPATIRARIGALARCADWGMRKKLILLPDHPFRSLPDGYSQYTKLDDALSGVHRTDIERDRRLEPGEEDCILTVIRSGGLPRKQRKFKIPHAEDVEALFLLALETAMRLRELYTLTSDQINLPRRTVYLDKTKNGDKRAVPLSSVAVSILSSYQDRGGHIFPWLGEQNGDLKRTSNYLSKLFSQIFDAAGCADFRWHDTRHEAISRLFERTNLAAEEIMKISGHRSHRMTMRYLALRGSDLASRLW